MSVEQELRGWEAHGERRMLQHLKENHKQEDTGSVSTQEAEKEHLPDVPPSAATPLPAVAPAHSEDDVPDQAPQVPPWDFRAFQAAYNLPRFCAAPPQDLESTPPPSPVLDDAFLEHDSPDDEIRPVVRWLAFTSALGHTHGIGGDTLEHPDPPLSDEGYLGYGYEDGE